MDQARSLILSAFLCLTVLLAATGDCLAQAVPYDIVYVRAPRYGDTQSTHWPEVFDPISMEPGAKLMLLHPNGSEEVLVDAGNGSIVDPMVSFDGGTVFYAKFHDLSRSTLNNQRRDAPVLGSDIYKIDLATRQETQLTFQEWTPNSGVTNWSSDPLRAVPSGTNYLGYGVMNLGPSPLPGNRLVFTSSRNGYLPNKDYSFPNLQLFVMDQDGKNVEQIGHLNLGSALHPVVLADGRVMFASYEGQGLRDQRNWSLWAIWPDGRIFEPLMSAFQEGEAFHYQTQLSDRDIAVVQYYNLNNNGTGTLLAFHSQPPPDAPPFGSPEANDPTNPLVRRGIWFFSPGHPSHLQPRYTNYPFSPPGLHSISAFTHGEDEASSKDLSGGWAGKVTHPAGAPNNDVLLVYTPGPANDLARPTTVPVYDGGIYIVRGGVPIDNHNNLVLVKNDPNYNELYPRPVVRYRDIYGIDAPANLSWLPNDGTQSAELPPGSPFGLIGTSSFYKRNSAPGVGAPEYGGMDVFNTDENGQSSNWGVQGADDGLYSNSDIYAVRILSMEPTSHISYGPNETNRDFFNHANERLRILGEIPLRKAGNVLDPDGNPDTSFLAKIPADVPFTFQTLDKDGLVLNMAQTWHQVRPGEVRTNCGGCHAHAQRGTDFAQTAAGRAGYQVADLTRTTPLLSKDNSGNPITRTVNAGAVDVEYYRDIRPILQRSCVQCHSGAGAAAGLVLDDTTAINAGSVSVERTYSRLADDSQARWGIKPVINNGTWRQSNASRYIREFQSRRSLLIWKLFGRRLDGWTNASHPTESVPGDKATLPPGSNVNYVDIDYTGTIMPPPSSGAVPLSEDEKILFARWVDLGAPVSSQAPADAKTGWFADELRPTLSVSLPRRWNPLLDKLRFGMFDYYSGLDLASLSVTADFPVDGRAAGAELKDLFQDTGSFVWSYTLQTPLTDLPNGTLTVSVKDARGNLAKVVRSFSISSTPPPDDDGGSGGGGGTPPGNPGGGGPSDPTGNQPPVIQLLQNPIIAGRKKVTLAAYVYDDLLPTGPLKKHARKPKPGTVTVVVEQLSGPDALSMRKNSSHFSNKGKRMKFSKKVKLTASGEYLFQITASDGAKSSTQTLQVVKP